MSVCEWFGGWGKEKDENRGSWMLSHKKELSRLEHEEDEDAILPNEMLRMGNDELLRKWIREEKTRSNHEGWRMKKGNHKS